MRSSQLQLWAWQYTNSVTLEVASVVIIGRHCYTTSWTHVLNTNFWYSYTRQATWVQLMDVSKNLGQIIFIAVDCLYHHLWNTIRYTISTFTCFVCLVGLTEVGQSGIVCISGPRGHCSGRARIEGWKWQSDSWYYLERLFTSLPPAEQQQRRLRAVWRFKPSSINNIQQHTTRQGNSSFSVRETNENRPQCASYTFWWRRRAKNSYSWHI